MYITALISTSSALDLFGTSGHNKPRVLPMCCKNSVLQQQLRNETLGNIWLPFLSLHVLCISFTFSQMQRQHAELAVRRKTGEYVHPPIHFGWEMGPEWKEADAQPPGVSTGTAQPTKYSTVDLHHSGVRMQIQGGIFLVFCFDESKGHGTTRSTRSESKRADPSTRALAHQQLTRWQGAPPLTPAHGALPSTAVAADWKQQGAPQALPTLPPARRR